MFVQGVKPLKENSQKGFSIVELMVSIVIGLIVLAGVIQVVFNSKTTFLHQEEMSYIQENARYAMSVIGRDIQNAGYWGCAGNTPIAAVAAIASNADARVLMGTDAINGYDNTGSGGTTGNSGSKVFPTPTDTALVWQTPSQTVTKPDSFVVRYADGIPSGIASDDGASFSLTTSLDQNVGGIVTAIAEDCRRIGVISTGGTAAGTKNLNYQQGNNCIVTKVGLNDESVNCNSSDPSGPTTPYLPGSVAMNYTSHAYFVEQSEVLSGEPALKRLYLDTNVGTQKEEVALGVEDMDILYSVKNGDNIQLKPAGKLADSEWNQVVAVQVSLLLRSRSALSQTANAVTYLGNIYNDRYLRQVVTSTFKLRNRI